MTLQYLMKYSSVKFMGKDIYKKNEIVKQIFSRCQGKVKKYLDNTSFLDKIGFPKDGRSTVKMIKKTHSRYFHYWWYKRVGL